MNEFPQRPKERKRGRSPTLQEATKSKPANFPAAQIRRPEKAQRLLHLVVNGFGVELFPCRVRPVNGDGARFAVGRDRNLPAPEDLSVLHRADVVSPIVDHFVGDGVVGEVSFHRISFAIEPDRPRRCASASHSYRRRPPLPSPGLSHPCN